ncbi:hypothetical protein D3C85_1889930 [compost metagenome]
MEAQNGGGQPVQVERWREHVAFPARRQHGAADGTPLVKVVVRHCPGSGGEAARTDVTAEHADHPGGDGPGICEEGRH